MTTITKPTSIPMGVAPKPGFTDPDGAVAHDHWTDYISQLRDAGWTVRQLGDRLAGGGKAGERAVYRWLDGTRVASRAVRRLAPEALLAPLVSEIILAIQSPHAALQRPTEASRIKGGGGADGSATRKDAGSAASAVDLVGSPSSPPPSLDPLILEAMKEYGVDEDTARAMLEGA